MDLIQQYVFSDNAKIRQSLCNYLKISQLKTNFKFDLFKVTIKNSKNSL